MAKSYTDEQRTALIDELTDPSKVAVYCAEHAYYGPQGDKPKPPHRGCAGCWKVYYLTLIAGIPPAQRQQWVDELEEVVTKLVEEVERGKFDIRLNRHPDIHIEKDTH